MAHLHSVYDSDAHFSINPITRALKNEASSKTSLIQYDHNSERFTFEIPRMIEGHDMSLCNEIRVHYINIDAKTKAQVASVYEVEDMQISPEGDDVVICSWLISRNATQLVGSLNFLIRFSCVTDGVVDYAWNTATYTGISVSSGINADETFEDDYVDVIEQWKASVLAEFEAEAERIADEMKADVTKWEEAESAKVRAEMTVFSDQWNTALDVERERISNIVALPEGSTTGDAELMDIRVGYDGKTYPTAGDAVRGQVGAVSDSFETVHSTNLLNPDTITLDEALSANGTKYTGTGYLLTDYIAVNPGDVLAYQGVLNGSGMATVGTMRFGTAYDNNKTIVASAGFDANKTSYTVPDGIAFVRLSLASTQYYEQNTIMLHFGASVLPYEPYWESKRLKAETHNDEHINVLIAEALEDSADSAFEAYTSTNLLNPETMTVGKGMSKNGTEYPGENYVLTDYIPVTSGDVITYQARSKGATVRWFYDMRFVCCFDEKKNILSALGVDANTKAFTVPDGVAYVRVTCSSWNSLLDHAVTKSATIIPYEAYRDVKMLKAESLPKNCRRLALPSTIYCFANQPVSIYFRNVMDYHPDDVYMMVASHTANDGKLYSDHWEYTPTAEGNRRVELKVYDHDYAMRNGELINLSIKATSAKNSLTALVIGDSTVNAGKETQKMLDLATADGYSLTLLGTRGTGANKHEGRAGWTAAFYASSATATGIANPFYNSATSAFDFAYYMAQQGYSGVDCVFLQLGINDMFSAQSDDEMAEALNTYLSNMEAIINSIHTYDANIKVVINLIIPCCADQDAFTGIYNIQTTSWRCKKNTYEANIALLDRYDGVSNVYLSPYNAALDTVNNMDGGVHPVDNGYAQLGTQMYSYMRAIN